MTLPAMTRVFPQSWSAEILRVPPLIAPTRSFTYPQNIAGEEDALSRGALHLFIRPRAGGMYLATCALGFTDLSMPTAIHACPNPDHLCAIAGGYAYVIDTARPEACTLLPLKPTVSVHPAPVPNLLLFLGFHTIFAWGADGPRWQTARLSWDGLTIREIGATHLHGLAWDLPTDRELPFSLDLATGHHTGSAFPASTS